MEADRGPLQPVGACCQELAGQAVPAGVRVLYGQAHPGGLCEAVGAQGVGGHPGGRIGGHLAVATGQVQGICPGGDS
eukprot:6036595-Lingulodinium_polyedra.AAC.1